MKASFLLYQWSMERYINIIFFILVRFNFILKHMLTLSFESTPDYDVLFTLLRRALQQAGGSESSQFDWERRKRSNSDCEDSFFFLFSFFVIIVFVFRRISWDESYSHTG
jgi:hypothetical protein